MAADIPVYDTIPTERVASDTVRVGDSLYSFDSADGGYLYSGPAVEEIEPLGYYSMYGSVGGGYEGSEGDIPIDREGMTPPSGVMVDPLTPSVVSHPGYPSGFGLMSPLGGEPSRIDWSTVPDFSLGGGSESTVGDIVVGMGGELMTGVPGGWESVGSLYGTPFWTPHEEYGGAGFGTLTPPDTLPDYTPIPGPRDFTGAGFGYAVPTPEPDYTAYVESYPDLGAAYTSYKAGGGPKYPTVADYGEWHWGKYGEPEGRELAMTEPYIPDDWYPFSFAPPSEPPFFTDSPELYEPPVLDEVFSEILESSPSLGVLESIATGEISPPSPIETPPTMAPPSVPIAETMPPMLPPEPVVDPYIAPVVDPYIASSVTPAVEPGSSIAAAMSGMTPSFEGGGGILCDPITGKCPNYG